MSNEGDPTDGADLAEAVVIYAEVDYLRSLADPDAICKELDRLDPEGKVDYEEWLAQYWKRLDDRRSGSV